MTVVAIRISTQRQFVASLDRLARHIGLHILHAIDAAQMPGLKAAVIFEIGAAALRWPMLAVMAIGIGAAWLLRLAIG